MMAGRTQPAGQMTFDLGHREAVGRADFLVSVCNREAATWIDLWPDWPAPARGLVLVGPAESGKSHLGAVWAERSRAARIDAATLTVEQVPHAIGNRLDVLIEGVDVRISDEALLHLYNIVAERGGSILMLSRLAPTRMGIALPDLSSRLATLPVAAIGLPDEALLAGVLAKHFADRQVTVRADVLAYLVARMERSFAAAGRLAERIDALSLAARRPITRDLARRALEQDEQAEALDAKAKPGEEDNEPPTHRND